MALHTIVDGDVAVLRLNLGHGNAIDGVFLDTVGGALDEALATTASAVVITGQGGAFSGGLDLTYACDLDREALGRFVDRFEAFFMRVLTWSRPVVAAINGHAIAGGAILAMAADYRIMSR